MACCPMGQRHYLAGITRDVVLIYSVTGLCRYDHGAKLIAYELDSITLRLGL